MKLIRVKCKDGKVKSKKADGSIYCKAYRKDTETCSIGCKKIQIQRGDACPFDDDNDAVANCPCYEK